MLVYIRLISRNLSIIIPSEREYVVNSFGQLPRDDPLLDRAFTLPWLQRYIPNIAYKNVLYGHDFGRIFLPNVLSTKYNLSVHKNNCDFIIQHKMARMSVLTSNIQVNQIQF